MFDEKTIKNTFWSTVFFPANVQASFVFKFAWINLTAVKELGFVQARAELRVI